MEKKGAGCSIKGLVAMWCNQCPVPYRLHDLLSWVKVICASQGCKGVVWCVCRGGGGINNAGPPTGFFMWTSLFLKSQPW